VAFRALLIANSSIVIAVLALCEMTCSDPMGRDEDVLIRILSGVGGVKEIPKLRLCWRANECTYYDHSDVARMIPIWKH